MRSAGAAVAAFMLLLVAVNDVKAEKVAVADCERDSAVDVWAAPDVEFCRRVMGEVFELAGVEPVKAEFDEEGMLVVSNAEVVCSAFRTPKLLEDYDFPQQPMGRMHYGLYVTKKQASRLFGARLPEGVRPKVAYSPVSQGQRGNGDRLRYFERAELDPEYVEYPTSAGAVEALKEGEVDALFLYTPYGKRPEGLAEIVPIGMRYVYFAVRKDRPELMERLSAAYREWYIDHIDRYDQWREELLGIPTPGNRVRIAAFERGELFRMSPEGRRSGRLEEWIRALCEVAHWTPDYVYGSFEQCLADVKSGRLDLMGGVTAQPERRADFLIPHTACGMFRIYLWAHRKSPYRSGRPETWGGMKLGLIAGTHSRLRVEEQVEKGGLDIDVREFALEREMLEAYASGEIDACVDVEMRELADSRALRLYEAYQMYFACSRSRPELFGELERAIETVCDDHPRYMRLIGEHHYGARGGIGELGAAETEWLAKRLKNPLPVVVDFSPWPFPMKDEKGKPVGFPAALLKELAKRTGLPFVQAAQTGGSTAEAKFLRGETQFWAPFPAEAEEYEAVPVFSFPVPEHCAKEYGAADPQAEFALLAQPGTPDALVSILRKGFEAISEEGLQEMMVKALAEQQAERKVFGLSDEELKRYGALAALGLFLLVTLYGAMMMRMVKGQAQRAEKAAMRAEDSAQSRTRFLAMMSHELRTPLNAVIGFAEFLAREDLPKAKREEFIQGIITSATALLDLVNDVLDLSKLETGAMHMRVGGCPVSAVMAELPSVFGYRTEHNGVKLEVRRTGDHEVPDVVLSRQGFRQVMLNLVGNASKFTLDGTITVEYGWEPNPDEPGVGTLRVAVKDTGCGIPPEKMERLFDPFVQDIASRMPGAESKTKGTGLGLPIVKRLVDSAGGTISVKSEVGKGTEFTIVLPSLVCVAAHAEDKSEGEATGSGGGGVVAGATAAPAEADVKVPASVLVVDDISVNRKVLGIHLRNLGAQDVRFAENGVKALEAMKEWTPELVLTDMWMPEMDGQQLSEAMGADERLAKVPLVAITADVEVENTLSVKRFAKILPKPVTNGKLRGLFRELVG